MRSADCAVRVEVLPARLGDCLIVECPRPGRPTWRMLVDGGPPDTWEVLKARIEALPVADRYLDLVVITHIDSDHIGGLIPLLSHQIQGLTIREVWFNGPPHLPDPVTRLTRSVRQGERVNALFAPGTQTRSDSPSPSPPPWNAMFDGAAVATAAEADFEIRQIPDGPRLTVLSPTMHRLAHLSHKWTESLDRAVRGEPEDQLPPKEPLQPLGDLLKLADSRTDRDRSVPNGSSIALLLEHRGASALLTGDAFGNVLGAGLLGLARARNQHQLPVDLFKLPHHTSRANVSRALVALAPARHYVTSTNGDRFDHPDDIAVARVAVDSPSGATLWFNYTTERTLRWARPDLMEDYNYSARYPDTPGNGVRIELEPRAT